MRERGREGERQGEREGGREGGETSKVGTFCNKFMVIFVATVPLTITGIFGTRARQSKSSKLIQCSLAHTFFISCGGKMGT